eukprot:gene24163-30477_t
MYFLTAKTVNLLTGITNVVHRTFPGIPLNETRVGDPSEADWFQNAPISAIYFQGPYILPETGQPVMVMSSRKVVNFPADSEGEQLITFVAGGVMTIERLAFQIATFRYTDGDYYQLLTVLQERSLLNRDTSQYPVNPFQIREEEKTAHSTSSTSSRVATPKEEYTWSPNKNKQKPKFKATKPKATKVGVGPDFDAIPESPDEVSANGDTPIAQQAGEGRAFFNSEKEKTPSNLSIVNPHDVIEVPQVAAHSQDSTAAEGVELVPVVPGSERPKMYFHNGLHRVGNQE